jgi:hypothetical protein
VGSDAPGTAVNPHISALMFFLFLALFYRPHEREAMMPPRTQDSPLNDRKNQRRVYVNDDIYSAIRLFAQDRWNAFRQRSPEGIPINRCFPYALEVFIKESGGGYLPDRLKN